MKNLDRKSILIGLLIPVAALIFMGAVKNVFSRYHTIRAQEVELVDGEGNIVFSLSEMIIATDDNIEEALVVDYGSIIENLESDIVLMDKEIQDLNEKLDGVLKILESKKSNVHREGPFFGRWSKAQMELCVSQGSLDFGGEVASCICGELENSYSNYDEVAAMFSSTTPDLEELQKVLTIFMSCGANFPN